MARRTESSHWHTQNFLRHPALARALIERAQLTSDDLIYEIGAGIGTIKVALAERCRAVIANEIDVALCEVLRRGFAEHPNVHVRCGDFLGEALPREPYKVFANPPFDITSAIVTRLVRAAHPPDDAFLVVQREAAARYSGRGAAPPAAGTAPEAASDADTARCARSGTRSFQCVKVRRGSAGRLP